MASQLIRKAVRITSAAVLATVLGTVSALAEELVVIRSTAPDIAVGAVLVSGETIDLPADTEVEILSERGNRTVISGPFSGGVQAQGKVIGTSRLERLRNAIFGTDGGTLVPGGTRRAEIERPGAEEDAGPVIPAVHVDLTQTGTWCVEEGAAVMLTRGDFERSRASLGQLPSGETAQLQWAGLDQRVPWPANVPVEDGSQYRVVRVVYEADTSPTRTGDGDQPIQQEVQLEPVILTMRLVEPAPNPAAAVPVLARNQCMTQFERAVVALTEPIPDAVTNTESAVR